MSGTRFSFVADLVPGAALVARDGVSGRPSPQVYFRTDEPDETRARAEADAWLAGLRAEWAPLNITPVRVGMARHVSG